MIISGIIRNAGYDRLSESLRQVDYRANNNIDIPYLILNTSSYPHYDKVVLTIHNIFDTKSLFEEYKCAYDIPTTNDKCKYERIRKYIINGSNVFIFYNRKFSYIPYAKLIIHDLNRESYNSIKSVLTSLNLISKLSQIEFTIDFFGPDLYLLKEFYENHVFLKHHQASCCTYRNKNDNTYTFYVGDTRKDSKAIRLYPKIIDGHEVLRLELVVNRRFIKSQNWDFSSLETLDTSIFTKFISFRFFNRVKFFGHIIYKRKEKIKARIKKNENRSASVYMSLLREKADKEGPLMQIVEHVKHGPYCKNNYGRFFGDLNECEDAFYNLIADKFFL